MAAYNLTTGVTFADIWKAQYPDGTMADIINETVENNLILQHAVWVRANNGMTHQGTRVATLPTSAFKRMGQGTIASAGSHVQFVEETQVRETWIEIEDEVLQKAPDPERYLQIQAMRAIQGIVQDSVQDMLYGNRGTTPDQINGLTVRYPNIQADRQLGRVLSATGATSSAQQSIWGIKWGEDGVFLIYPFDHPDAGVKSQVFGPENRIDSNNRLTRVYRVRVQFAFGLGVGNRRAIFRLANIEGTAGTPITQANWPTLVENNLMTLLNDALNDGMGYRLYANNFVKTQFDIRVKDKGNVWYSPNDPFNAAQIGNYTMFAQTPVYKLERLINTEAVVT